MAIAKVLEWFALMPIEHEENQLIQRLPYAYTYFCGTCKLTLDEEQDSAISFKVANYGAVEHLVWFRGSAEKTLWRRIVHDFSRNPSQFQLSTQTYSRETLFTIGTRVIKTLN
jgi:hypothetical protein